VTSRGDGGEWGKGFTDGGGRLRCTAGRSDERVLSASSEACRTISNSDSLRRRAADVRTKVDCVGWDACKVTGSCKAGMLHTQGCSPLRASY
jgi:hypothetical protein